MGSTSTYAIKRPLARADGLLVRELDGETVVYDLESKQAHCLKALAAAVFAAADGQSSHAEIAALVRTELGTTVDDGDVAEAVRQLDTAGLLDVPLPVHLSGEAGADEPGVPRREALRRIGFAGAGAAMATTLITSIVAPSAAMAQSGIPPGCSGCGKNPDCTSNHCCQSVPGKQCNASCCVGSNNSCHGTGCTCVGGANNGQACNTTTCPGGACVCSQCTVCASDLSGDTCPGTCPSGSHLCCNPSC